jgi:endo-1,4-beta-xylanase
MENRMRITAGLFLISLLSGLLTISCATKNPTQNTKIDAVKSVANTTEKPVPTPSVEAKEITKSGIGSHNGYTYEFWNQNEAGSPVMTLGEGSTFGTQWSGIFNMLARIGIRPGFDATKVTYKVEDYRVSRGISYLCVYGWTYNKGTKDNLVEFYIVDNWINYRPPGGGGKLKGTVVVDGDEYDIYTSLRTQQPSIFGTRTFNQYWSVRKSGQQRTSGIIDVVAHFNAWKELGMEFGDTLYEVSFCVEGYESGSRGEGNAKITELTFSGQ